MISRFGFNALSRAYWIVTYSPYGVEPEVRLEFQCAESRLLDCYLPQQFGGKINFSVFQCAESRLLDCYLKLVRPALGPFTSSFNALSRAYWIVTRALAPCRPTAALRSFNALSRAYWIVTKREEKY